MSHLIQSIILCLLVALVLGFILGWLFKAMVSRPIYADGPNFDRQSSDRQSSDRQWSDRQWSSDSRLGSRDASHAVATGAHTRGNAGSRRSRARQVQRDDFIFVDR